MKKPIVFMFSGQGSQYFQMGQELYEKHPRFKLWMDHCDELTRAFIPVSIIEVIYKSGKKAEPFDRLLYTNPALLSIEYSLARILMEMDIRPDYLLGYSLGEITASVVSGAVTLREGLEFVVEYAQLLEESSPPAGMLAILAPVDIIDQFSEDFKHCWLTGKNFQSNFVVSGLIEDIKNLQSTLTQKNILSQILPVNYGFHTPLMDPIVEQVRSLAHRINFLPIRIPIISSLYAEILKEVSNDYFWEVTRYPVQFDKTISTTLRKEDCIFIDVGPSGTLATFVKYLLPSGASSSHFELMNQFGKDIASLEKLRTNIATKLAVALT